MKKRRDKKQNRTRIFYKLTTELGSMDVRCAYTKNEVIRLVGIGYKVYEVEFTHFRPEVPKILKLLKEIYQTFLILSYSFNFFGGGFFYSILVTRNESSACGLAMIFMGLSLFLYIKMDVDRETVFESVKRPSFNLTIWLMYLLPVLARVANVPA